MQEIKENELPPAKTNWPKVYFIVMAWFVAFVLFMYLFTQLTA